MPTLVPTFTDGFHRSDRPLDGDNGWSTPGSWKIQGDGQAYLRETGGANAAGHVLITRDAGTANDARHIVSANFTSAGSHDVTGEGLIWGANENLTDYWYTRWSAWGGGVGEGYADGSVTVGHYYDGAKHDIVTAGYGTITVTVYVDHNFQTGQLTVTAWGGNEGNFSVYSGVQPHSVSNGRVGFWGRNTGHGGVFSPRHIVRDFSVSAYDLAPDKEGYGYKGGGLSNRIAFGPHKGPDRGVSRSKYLAWARTDDELVIGTTTKRILGLTWESLAEERVDSGVAIQGIASTATALRVEVTRGEAFDVSQSWVHQLEPGQPQLVAFPWVLDEPPEGSWRYRLQLRVDTGTFTIDPGYVSWFIVRRG